MSFIEGINLPIGAIEAIAIVLAGMIPGRYAWIKIKDARRHRAEDLAHAEKREATLANVEREKLEFDKEKWYHNVEANERASTPPEPREAPPSTPYQPFNIPFASLKGYFKGREDKIEALEQHLLPADALAAPLHQQPALQNKPASAIMHGLGGAGKTRLAVEFAYKHRARFGALLFVTVDPPVQIMANFNALIKELEPQLSGQLGLSEEQQTDLVLRKLRELPGYLLILDNCDQPKAQDSLKTLLPKLDTGTVIVTSRLNTWRPGPGTLDVSGLRPGAAVDLLLHRKYGKTEAAEPERQVAEELAKALDYLPLMLEQASAQIAAQNLSFEGYLDLWNKQSDKIHFDEADVSSEYKRSAAVTWNVSIRAAGADAKALLRYLAQLAPEPVPQSLLDIAEAQNLLTLPKKGTVTKALSQLRRFHLIEDVQKNPEQGLPEKAIKLHRVVHAVTRRAIPQEQASTLHEQAIDWLNAALPKECSEYDASGKVDVLMQHVMVLLQDYSKLSQTLALAALLNHRAEYLYLHAQYEQAEPLYREVLELRKRALGSEHPDVASSINNLASLLNNTGRYAEAEPLYREALELYKRALGPEHPDVALSLNNLASLLNNTGRYAEAEPLYREALELYKRALGPEHPDVALSLNNLAELLKNTGRYAEAEPLHREALELRKRALGPEHPDVASSMNNLALLLNNTGRYAEAEPLCREALELLEASLGREHPHTVLVRENLELFLEARGWKPPG